MERKTTAAVIGLLAVLCVAPLGRAEVEWRVQKTLRIEGAPIDITISRDGSRFFVLTDRGVIRVYDANGGLDGELEVGRHVDQIEIGPREDLMFAGSRGEKTVELLEIDYIQKIDVNGSPSRGPADAPVVVAVFSEFQ